MHCRPFPSNCFLSPLISYNGKIDKKAFATELETVLFLEILQDI